MWDRWFGLTQWGTSVRQEIFAGLTTFLAMAQIIFVQPAVLADAGMNPGAVTAATCISAALASGIMGIYGRYPVAQAPGMGENFFFTFSRAPVGTDPSADPGAVSVGRAARCCPSSPLRFQRQSDKSKSVTNLNAASPKTCDSSSR